MPVQVEPGGDRWVTVVSDDLDAREVDVREVDARLARRALWASGLAAPMLMVASAVIAAWLHVEGVADRRLVGWVAAIVAVEFGMIALAVWGLRRPARLMLATNVAVVGSFIAMALCALLSVWAGDVGGRDDIPVVYQLWVCGTAASAMAIAGPMTRFFVSGPVAQLALNTVLILTGAAGIATPIAVLCVLFIVVLAFGHVGTRWATRTAIANELRSQRLLDELSDVNDLLAHEATHDLLTGIANRRRIIDELGRGLARTGRGDHHLAVLFIDLDGFKEINDSYGHAVGDELLVIAARRIATELAPGDLVGRQGGDEFIVLVRSTDRTGAHDIAERVRVTIEGAFRIGEHILSVSASIGVVWCDKPGLVADDVLRRADVALYRAKDRGRNCVIEFGRDDPVLGDEHAHSVAELRAALQQQRIVAWFQPVVDLDTGAILGAEALARWPQPDGSVLGPAHFLRALTEAGLDTDLGIHMALQIVALREAISDVVPDSFRMGLNVTFRRVRARDAIEALASLESIRLRSGASVLRGMTIEVTENAAVRDLDETRAALERARELGMAIALDDFGTGHSSLTLVRQLPLDVIKLDRAFVNGLADDPANQAVVAAVVDIAAGVGGSVVAEGVERVEDAARLRALGCRMAQGFLYSPAVPGDTLRAWMEHGAPWQERREETGRRSALSAP